MPVTRKVIGYDPNGAPIYEGDAPTLPSGGAPSGGYNPTVPTPTTAPAPAAGGTQPAPGNSDGIGGTSFTPGKDISEGIRKISPDFANNFVDKLFGGGGAPSSTYDPKAELAKSEAMAGNVYGNAQAQAAGIARGGAPTSTVTAQQINAPGAINSQQIGTPDILGGDKASYLRQLTLDQAAKAAASPSAAAAQMAANQQAISHQQLGVAAGARGVDRATARRDAMLGIGNQGQAAASSTAALAATEQAQKQAAYTQALGGVRTGDVGVSQAQTQIGAQNLAGDLEAQRATAADTLAAATANQGADLTASQATANNTLQGWTAKQAAQNAANATALQGVGATNQAQGVAATYGTGQNEAAAKANAGFMGAVGGGLTAILSDEDAKLDIKPIDATDRYNEILAPALSLSPSNPTGPTTTNPSASPNQDFLKWKPSEPQQDQSNPGLLGGILGALSDERAKQQVDTMGSHELIDFAHKVPMATFRYKPGVGEDDGQDVHAGTLAGALQGTGPLGRLMVHEGPDGLKRVDYGRLGGVTLAAAAMLNERVKKLEKGRR